METTCTRCHRAVQAESCFCSYCGMPQLTYESDGTAGTEDLELLSEGLLDAGTVAWKPALRAAMLLAVPAGLLASDVSPLGMTGMLWVALGAALAVVVYVRRQRAPWITMGAGARIGLVTGLMAAWLAFSVSGGALFVQRYVLHHASQIDADWKSRVEMSEQAAQQWTSGLMSASASQARTAREQQQAWMLSPWGHAGVEALGFAINALLLLFFATGGGALGARWLARMRRSGL